MEETTGVGSPKAKLLSLSVLLYGLPIYIFSVFPFSKRLYPNFNSFESPILNFILGEKIQYSSLGIIFDVFLLYCLYILFFKKNIVLQNERVYIIFGGIKKIFRAIFIDKLKGGVQISKEEKVSLLFYLVKIFWTPLMLIFAIENSTSLIKILQKDNNWTFTGENVLNLYFPLYISAIFTVDTVIFSLGYLLESKRLKNVVKSVEPTVLGWASALACYGPFFDTFTRISGGLPHDFADFGDTKLNIIFGLSTIFFFTTYVWASVALGFKASNLTNRGIVTRGPYKYVRHPAYAAKNIGWIIASIPMIKINATVTITSLAIWILVYYVRAITEERHLRQDPDYVAYSQKVKYMFIPGII